MAVEMFVTETYPVGASYEGVQADGDCSANPLGNDSQQWSDVADTWAHSVTIVNTRVVLHRMVVAWCNSTESTAY